MIKRSFFGVGATWAKFRVSILLGKHDLDAAVLGFLYENFWNRTFDLLFQVNHAPGYETYQNGLTMKDKRPETIESHTEEN